MNIDECAKVLAKIQLGDNRQADKATLAEWFDSIKTLRFEDAVEAVTIHRQESTEYLQPAHIHRNVRRIVTDRVEAQKALMARTDFEGHRSPTTSRPCLERTKIRSSSADRLLSTTSS